MVVVVVVVVVVVNGGGGGGSSNDTNSNDNITRYNHILTYNITAATNPTTGFSSKLNEEARNSELESKRAVDFRNFIMFSFFGRDPGTLKSDIVSKNIHN